MPLLSILKYPAPQLRQPCDDIAQITDDIRRLADDMLETMYAASGIGLAAPQIGRSLRLLVLDVGEHQPSPLQLANPTIVDSDGEISSEEGCLSVPNMRAIVPRAQSVVVSGLDMDGREKTVSATDLLAVCLQHEIDHLNGVLFFDHISKFKRTRLLERYRKQSQQS